MNLEDLVAAVHVLHNSDTDTPSVTDDDGLLYTALLNNAVSRWYSEGIEWRELWTTLSSAATGDKNVVAGQTLYTTPTDFQRLGSYVKFYNGNEYVKFNVVSQTKARQLSNTGQAYAYVIGSPKTGYQIRLSIAPSVEQDNWTLDYDYYKYPTKFTAASSVSECPDPYFLVHHAVSELKKADEDAYGHSTSLREAENRLAIMRSENHRLPEFEQNTIEILDDWGFGV